MLSLGRHNASVNEVGMIVFSIGGQQHCCACTCRCPSHLFYKLLYNPFLMSIKVLRTKHIHFKEIPRIHSGPVSA